MIGPELALAGLLGSRICVSHVSLPPCASISMTKLSYVVPVILAPQVGGVVRQISQFAGSGFCSIASVTETNLRPASCASPPRPPIKINVTSATIACNRFMTFLPIRLMMECENTSEEEGGQ